MKAISLSRPWPYAFLHLGKRVENRQRKDGRMPSICRHRGPLLLHAAKSWDKTAADWMVERELADLKLSPFLEHDLCNPSGAIVGRCRAIGHIDPQGWVYFGSDARHPTRVRSRAEAMGEGLDLRWWMGGFALVLADVEPTNVVPSRGMLGLWTVPPEALEAL